MPVTMKDVAAEAGVSPTVVSRVLHNKATAIRVSEPTAERVRKAAKDLGYRVNVMARNFRDRQTMMIGVLHGIGFERPVFHRGSKYFAALMDGVIEGAFRHGYSVTFCPKLLGQSPEDALADGRFDGLIWYSTYPNGDNRRMLEGCSVPLALIHTSTVEFNNRFPSVVCDNDQGIGLAVEHLVALGHRRIAYANDSGIPFGESLERFDAFRRHMRLRGLSFTDADCLDSLRAEEYFRGGVSHTAIVASNDGIAAIYLNTAPRFGVRVPDDLSVVGFDSTDYCNELRPTLTSVSQPLDLMGQSAVDLLVQSIKGEAPDPPAVIYPCGLDVRGSTTSTSNRCT